MSTAVSTAMLVVSNHLPRTDAALGLVRAEGLQADRTPPGFEALLEALLAARRAALTAADEAVRAAARDLLRNGRYKPTGRGKPASEYLVRAVQADDYRFPRINAPVDVCNYVSLRSVLPVSLWDLDRAATDRFVFRLGRAGEAYVFNTGGQVIDLEDLVVGCRVPDDGAADGEPIVNPVKDCLATKTTDATRHVAACIYAPLAAVTPGALAAHCRAFADLLAGCGDAVAVNHAVALPGETVRV